jgi:hypothetical protein
VVAFGVVAFGVVAFGVVAFGVVAFVTSGVLGLIQLVPFQDDPSGHLMHLPL